MSKDISIPINILENLIKHVECNRLDEETILTVLRKLINYYSEIYTDVEICKKILDDKYENFYSYNVRAINGFDKLKNLYIKENYIDKAKCIDNIIDAFSFKSVSNDTEYNILYKAGSYDYYINSYFKNSINLKNLYKELVIKNFYYSSSNMVSINIPYLLFNDNCDFFNIHNKCKGYNELFNNAKFILTEKTLYNSILISFLALLNTTQFEYNNEQTEGRYLKLIKLLITTITERKNIDFAIRNIRNEMILMNFIIKYEIFFKNVNYTNIINNLENYYKLFEINKDDKNYLINIIGSLEMERSL